MKLVKRNYQPLLNTFFDDFLTKDFFGAERNFPSFKSDPSINILSNDDSFGIELVAPGLKKEDFKLEVENDLLTVSFEKKEEKEETGKYTRREFSSNSFKSSFTIPEAIVDTNAIEAKYEDGILKLHLPKKEEAKIQPKRIIEIG